ncbi:hypothetical protein PR202_ga03524 [Eleusine coracana subsp. coracana]|uniref:Uncharacterized protein n=1 Tax=Eleusine coracana subsp. coracana TaxID=191504 RepID=A0AAV5BNM8_ELECO|nr:hypothetical protein PR202_ga03524 [Eleusine coracana subsp. coracana]
MKQRPDLDANMVVAPNLSHEILTAALTSSLFDFAPPRARSRAAPQRWTGVEEDVVANEAIGPTAPDEIHGGHSLRQHQRCSNEWGVVAGVDEGEGRRLLSTRWRHGSFDESEGWRREERVAARGRSVAFPRVCSGTVGIPLGGGVHGGGEEGGADSN